MRFPFARALAFALLSSAFAASIANAANLGNVYSYRQPYLSDPLFKEFTDDETAIKVNVIFAEKGLIERIQAEGRNSPADVVLTVDVGNLTQATGAGISQPIQRQFLKAQSRQYTASDREWGGAYPLRPRGLCIEGAGEAGHTLERTRSRSTTSLRCARGRHRQGRLRRRYKLMRGQNEFP